MSEPKAAQDQAETYPWSDQQIGAFKHYLDVRIKFLIACQLGLPIEASEHHLIKYENDFDAIMKGKKP